MPQSVVYTLRRPLISINENIDDYFLMGELPARSTRFDLAALLLSAILAVFLQQLWFQMRLVSISEAVNHHENVFGSRPEYRMAKWPTNAGVGGSALVISWISITAFAGYLAVSSRLKGWHQFFKFACLILPVMLCTYFVIALSRGVSGPAAICWMFEMTVPYWEPILLVSSLAGALLLFWFCFFRERKSGIGLVLSGLVVLQWGMYYFIKFKTIVPIRLDV